MESLNEDKSISVAANKDRGCLPNLQHTLGDLADSLRPECGPSFHRDIDFGDWEALALEHEPYLFGRLIPRRADRGSLSRSGLTGNRVGSVTGRFGPRCDALS